MVQNDLKVFVIAPACGYTELTGSEDVFYIHFVQLKVTLHRDLDGLNNVC